MNIKQRHFIKSSEIKLLKEEILKQYNQEFVEKIFPTKAKVEVILTEEGDTLYAINDELKLWKSKEGYVPVLTLLLNRKVELKKVIVDMGAIKYVTNGADIMRPGITEIDSKIKRGEIVVIVDETHDRALAIGKALFNAAEMKARNSGKVVKNLHTIQDTVWEFEKEFK
jgi:PUA-domain protein